jgi:hypothetical protein
MKSTSPPKVKKFPAAKQRMLDALLDKNSEGTISAAEKARLVQLVAEAECLMVANAKSMAEFSRSESISPPAAAVPVTVWIHADQVSR